MPEHDISVSVIVPCRNESAHILACLESILTWPDPEGCVEILVVDGESTDTTRDIVQALAARHPRMRLLNNSRQSSAAALNIGLAAARGRWILRADAHSEYPIDYLQRCLETAASTGADNVGGLCISQLRKDTVSAQLVRAVTTHSFGVGDALFRTNGRAGWVDTVPFGFYRRDAVHAIGGWDERFAIGSGDYEFNQRLRHWGGRIWLNPEIQVFYYNQQKFFAFLKKVFTRDGPANALMWRLCPYTFHWRHAVPLATVIVCAVLTAVSLLTASLHFALAGGMLCYGVLAMVAAAAQAYRHRKPWMMFLVPVAFFLYHCAYGLGTVWGFFRSPLTRPRAKAVPYVPGVLLARAARDESACDVSIIIPCRNEARFIRRCLDSVLSMNSGRRSIEILVIDGESTDGTAQIVGEYSKRDSRIRLLNNPLLATAPALNLGLAHASGEWIIRLDAHAWYEPDYLCECLRVALETGADAVGGTCIAELSEVSIWAQLVRAITTHSFGVGSSRFRTSTTEGRADTVLFGCYRRKVFEKAGTWDERLSTGSEDFELNQRILNSGHTLWFSPGIRTHYFNKSRIREFLMKVLKRDGPCNPWMWYLWPSAFRMRHAIPMCFVAVLAATAIACWWTLLPLYVLALAYFSTAILASVRQAFRYRQWPLAALAPIAFLLYHLAYGLGGWYGVYLLLRGKAPVSPGNIHSVPYTQIYRQSATH